MLALVSANRSKACTLERESRRSVQFRARGHGYTLESLPGPGAQKPVHTGTCPSHPGRDSRPVRVQKLHSLALMSAPRTALFLGLIPVTWALWRKSVAVVSLKPIWERRLGHFSTLGKSLTPLQQTGQSDSSSSKCTGLRNYLIKSSVENKHSAARSFSINASTVLQRIYTLLYLFSQWCACFISTHLPRSPPLSFIITKSHTFVCCI